MSSQPLLVGRAGREILGQQIGCHQRLVSSLRGDREFTLRSLAHDAVFSHQARDAVLASLYPLALECSLNTRAAIGPSAGLVLAADGGQQLLIGLLPLAGRSLSPIIITA